LVRSVPLAEFFDCDHEVEPGPEGRPGTSAAVLGPRTTGQTSVARGRGSARPRSLP
jgi:hypothetical protein